MAATSLCKAQNCDNLRVDLTTGTLNGVAPTASPEEVKAQLPCFTGETAEGEIYNYGGGVFFLNHDFYFYTYQDYLEIRKDFKGTLSQPVMGATAKRLIAMIGQPDRKTGDYQGHTAFFYRTDYGTLRLSFDSKGRQVVEVGIHAVPPSQVKLND
jgi:hypothetical protein